METTMDLQLAGKRALVTGGSRGIGKVIAQALALEGVDVAIAARTHDALDKTAHAIGTATGRRIVPLVADTGDDASVAALVAAAHKALGGLDIVVNNAAAPGGAGPAARLAEVTGANLLEDVNVKVGGYLRVAQAAAPYLVEQGWGRIINIGGLAARRTGHYVASVRNAGVSAITKNLADELGSRGINVNAISPGATRTERTDAASAERAGKNTTIGRIVEAEEIAWLVLFLASPKSAAINGETIAAGGGSPGVINF
jgi:NAD(P)-dependent dehydrogenase (short-subunit alcohol dehydrogenase family)